MKSSWECFRFAIVASPAHTLCELTSPKSFIHMKESGRQIKVEGSAR